MEILLPDICLYMALSYFIISEYFWGNNPNMDTKGLKKKPIRVKIFRILMDRVVVVLVIAVLTVRFIVIAIVGIIVVDQSAAVTAGGVVVVVAVVAEGVHTVPFCFVPPDAVHAAVTKGGSLVQTLFAKGSVVEFVGVGW